jgi:hypothetical protein
MLAWGVGLWCALGGSLAAQTPGMPAANGPRGLFGALPVVSASPAPGGKVVPEPVPPQDVRDTATPPKDQGDESKSCGCQPWWSRVPVVQPTPRTGWFLIPPTGPGYYSFVDWVHDGCREKAPKYPYPRYGFLPTPMFDVDWRYLDDPKNTEKDCFDSLKRRKICDDFMVSVGGEFRYRHNNFTNFALGGKNNNFDLYRARVYTDIWYRDRIRIFAEFIDAQSRNQDVPPIPADRNFGDFLNLFAEVRLLDIHGQPVFVRAGRQELLFGSQRLISTVDWLNDRRTFQGARGYWRSEKFDFDVFGVQPIIFDARRFDSVDNNIVFSGAWGTYRPKKNQTIDLYYLNLDDTSHIHPGQNSFVGAANTHTIGSRYAGDWKNILWDFEGMLQLGDWANQTTYATAYTTGVGYNFKDVAWNPSLWFYYDYASGDPHPGSGGTHRTFNQLFGFGHYYFGWIDVVGRQNIHDVNMQLGLYPTKWITTQLQYHIFRLDQAKDSLFNAAGAPIRHDPTGLAGTDVGQELDLLTSFHLTKHQDFVLGYSHLFAGDFLRQTGPAAGRRDIDFFYAQWGFRW